MSLIQSRRQRVVAVGQILRDAAGTDVGVVHPQPGDQLEACPGTVSRARSPLVIAVSAPSLHAAGGERDPVRRHPVDLHHQHADQLRARRHVDAQQLLHGQAVRGLVVERREVIGAGQERDALRPRAVFGVLLDARVQVANHDAHVGDRLALEFEHQPQHAVRGRVLRSHVEDEPLLGDRVGAEHLFPVTAGQVVDPALCGLAWRVRTRLSL